MAEKVGDPGEYGKFRKIVTKKLLTINFPQAFCKGTQICPDI